MIDVKCKNCNRTLMKAVMVVAAVKCPRCGKIFEYQVYSNIHLTNAEDPKETKSMLHSTHENRSELK